MKNKTPYFEYLEFLDEMLYSVHHKINNIENLTFPNEGIIKEIEYFTDGGRTMKGLDFLKSEGYIKEANPYDITYKGIMKLSKGGFEQEFLDNEENRKFIKSVNKSTWVKNYLTVFISIIALVISIISLYYK